MKLTYTEELELRARARDDGAAREVLVDYYLASGQPSRAKLWQEASLPIDPPPTEYTQDVGRPDPDLHPYSFDRGACPPRDILIWMCRNQESKFRTAEIVGLSRSRVGELARKVDRQIAYAAIKEQRQPTMAATERLLAAGALGVIDLLGGSVKIPPHDWPAPDAAAARRRVWRAQFEAKAP